MNTEFSIIDPRDEFDSGNNKSDISALFVKGVIGVAPFVGPIIAETVSAIIPNQKLDRTIIFVKTLNEKIKHLDRNVVELKMKSEEFADLLEDALIQAAKSPSDERKEYIAAHLKNSISYNDLENIEKKKLLSLLNEINDAEVLYLKFYSLLPTAQRDFSEQYKELFTPIRQTIGAPQEDIEKVALRTSYKNKLVEVGLINPKYQRPKKGELPEFDENTGRIKSNSFQITRLGELLLKYIDLDVQDVQTAQE